MNELEQILRDEFKKFTEYVELPNSHYYYYDDEYLDHDHDEDELPVYMFDRYAELVNFAPLIELAKQNELKPELFKIQLEKKILTGVKTALTNDIAVNKWFVAKTNWKPLDQLLTLFRLKELKSAGITRRGGRGKGKTFDVSTLAATFFGKQILNGLEMGRRRSLNQEELDLLKAECAKLKLTLPEIIEPTTTERYFAPAEETEDAKVAGE